MSLPTNGITPEVIRESMPPYQLSADLLAAIDVYKRQTQRGAHAS